MSALSAHVKKQEPVAANPAPPVVSKEDLDADVLATGPRTVVTISPNPANAEAAAVAYSNLRKEMDEKFGKDLQETKEGMENLHTQITATNESGGFDSVSAYFAALSMESYTSFLGLEGKDLLASFESAIATPNNTTVISTESLETMIREVATVEDFASKKTFSMEAASPLLNSHQRGLDNLIRKLVVKSKSQQFAAPEAVVWQYQVVIDGQPSANLPKDYETAIEYCHYLTTTFRQRARADYLDNVKLVKEVYKKRKEKGKEADPTGEDLKEILDRWKDPRKVLGDDPDRVLIGGFQLLADRKIPYTGTDPIALGFAKLAYHTAPTPLRMATSPLSFHDQWKKTEHPIKLFNSDNIVSIGDKLLNMKPDGVLATVKEAMDNASDTVVLVRNWFRAMGPYKARSRADKKAGTPESVINHRVSMLVAALTTSYQLPTKVPGHAAWTLERLKSNFLKLATISMKKGYKVSMETWDQQTATDGFSVNETSPIEPTQKPAAGAQAPVGEVDPKEATFQDGPGSVQDLNGSVQIVPPVKPSGEAYDNSGRDSFTLKPGQQVPAVLGGTPDVDHVVKKAVLTGKAPTGFSLPAAATADNHADGTPVPAVRAPKPDVDPVVRKDASLRGTLSPGVKVASAATADNIADDNKAVAPAVRGGTPDVAAVVKKDVALRATLEKASFPRPYWYRGK